MTGYWITDIRHFLDEQSRVPDDLLGVPRYMGAIVAAVSLFPAGLVDRPAGFSLRAAAAWNAIVSEIRQQLLNNFWCGACRSTASVDDRPDEIVLALLHLNSLTDHGVTRAWKGFDRDSLERLHSKGPISDPKSRARPVVLSGEGARAAEELFAKHLAGTETQDR